MNKANFIGENFKIYEITQSNKILGFYSSEYRFVDELFAIFSKIRCTELYGSNSDSKFKYLT